MKFYFGGLMSYEEALLRSQVGEILGFEAKPVVTFGGRAKIADELLWSPADFESQGYTLLKTDRGGHATIHNPGQLVIFPNFEVRTLGVRRFMGVLESATRKWMLGHGLSTIWNPCDPGLYTAEGKVVSFGLRISRGVTRHGLAINILNDLSPFQGIKVCGKKGQMMAHFPTMDPLPVLFSRWVDEFTAQLTLSSQLSDFGKNHVCAPSSVG